YFSFFQAEDGIRDRNVTGVQTCALPILCFMLVLILLRKTTKLLLLILMVSFLIKVFPSQTLKQVVINLFLCLISLKLIPPMSLLVWKQLVITGLVFILI